jgi:hypothetical protein
MGRRSEEKKKGKGQQGGPLSQVPGRPHSCPAGAQAAVSCARKLCPVPPQQKVHQSWFPASPKVASFEVQWW